MLWPKNQLLIHRIHQQIQNWSPGGQKRNFWIGPYWQNMQLLIHISNRDGKNGYKNPSSTTLILFPGGQNFNFSSIGRWFWCQNNVIIYSELNFNFGHVRCQLMSSFQQILDKHLNLSKQTCCWCPTKKKLDKF